jgi:hypothetical protein
MVSQRYYDFSKDDPLDLGESLWLTSHISNDPRGRELIKTILKVSCVELHNYAYSLHLTCILLEVRVSLQFNRQCVSTEHCYIHACSYKQLLLTRCVAHEDVSDSRQITSSAMQMHVIAAQRVTVSYSVVEELST